MQSPFRQNYAQADETVVRNIMQQVYLWMSLAMLTTAITAFATIESGMTNNLQQSPGLLFGAFILELGLVVGISWGINRISAGLATILFFTYAALNGFTLSLIINYYTTGSVTAAFVSTAALFGAMSIYGYTTNADLQKYRTYLFMGLIGLLVASVVNIFIGSSALEFAVSLFGVLLFTALTAYNTQRIKVMAASVGSQADGSTITRLAILGALILYIDFINLFIYILRLTGQRR
jgi:uncharacterized protein